MRHRAVPKMPASTRRESATTTPGADAPTTAGAPTTIVEDRPDLPASEPPGKHRATPRLPRQAVPQQSVPEQAVAEQATPHQAVPDEEALEPEVRSASPTPPQSARWRSSHLPRILAAGMLLIACVGTTSLVVRYAEARTTDHLAALALGVTVIIGLWALLIASTPQLVTLNGSVLTVRNSRGVEKFDLADGLQPVDLVEEPDSPRWALLLHRADGSSVILHRRDVAARELDPIVRHYRRIADRSWAGREARFDR